MGKIALISDRATSTYFKVTGISSTFAVKDREDAEKAFRRVHSDETISLVMVTEPVFEWLLPIIERTKKEFPLVVSIPGKSGSRTQADALAQLIKRTVGIDIKMK
ncbi:MAG: V-type ATP synthase subunit F [Candidatus Bathyarchaeia archaeon]